MKYRPEIDGLRAIAVVPVILFHAGFSVFSGGYVGVDIFFVISGYLIATIILTELEAGTFSIIKFYERRARRILPALFFVIICTLPFAWRWMPPNELEEYAKSMSAVAAFISNFHFWKESGYFAQASELQPLLHTWSLAVEEQFYMIFPLLLMVLWRFGFKVITAILVIMAVLSLGLSEWGSKHFVDANFYLIPTRAWELLIGVFVAQFMLKNPNYRHPTRDNIGGLVGIALIIYAMFFFDDLTPFPGFYALVPTLGTGLIILFSTGETLVGRILSLRGLVGIGLISYSAYLWHQPIFAFARLRNFSEPSQLQYAVLSFAAVMMAWASWRYVERPFRNKNVVSRKTGFKYAISIGVLLIGIGVVTDFASGFSDRFDRNFDTAFLTVTHPNFVDCKLTIPKVDECVVGSSVEPTVAIIGDSHARALANYIETQLDQLDISAVQLSRRGCPPILNLERVGHSRDCATLNADVYDYFARNENLEIAVISARWTFYLESHPFDNLEGRVERGEDVVFLPLGVDNDDLTEDQMKQLIARFYREAIEKFLALNRKTILVYPVPEVGWDPERVAFFMMQFRDIPFDEIELSTSYDVFKERNRAAYEALDAIPDHPNLFRVYPAEIFCDTFVRDRCVAATDGKQYYRDDDHLGELGARLVNAEIIKIIQHSSDP